MTRTHAQVKVNEETDVRVIRDDTIPVLMTGFHAMLNASLAHP